jgi:hypothetical protein
MQAFTQAFNLLEVNNPEEAKRIQQELAAMGFQVPQ